MFPEPMSTWKRSPGSVWKRFHHLCSQFNERVCYHALCWNVTGNNFVLPFRMESSMSMRSFTPPREHTFVRWSRWGMVRNHFPCFYSARDIRYLLLMSLVFWPTAMLFINTEENCSEFVSLLSLRLDWTLQLWNLHYKVICLLLKGNKESDSFYYKIWSLSGRNFLLSSFEVKQEKKN